MTDKIEYILPEDTANEGRKKINSFAIDAAARAEVNSENAEKRSVEANDIANKSYSFAKDVSESLASTIAGLTKDSEVIKARKPLRKTAYTDLGTRLNKQFGDDSDFFPNDFSMIEKIKKQTLGEFVDVRWFGAKGNGVNDDTNAINNAIKWASENGSITVYIPAGTYMIKGTNGTTYTSDYLRSSGGISLMDNITLDLHEKAILKLMPANYESYNIIRATNVNNVTITGGTIIGDLEHNNISSYSCGIIICGGSDILVKDVKIKDVLGRGIYSTFYNKTDTEISRVDSLTIEGCSIENIGGTPLVIESVDTFISRNNTFGKTAFDPWDIGVKIVGDSEENKIGSILFENCMFNDNLIGLYLSGRYIDSIELLNIDGSVKGQSLIKASNVNEILARNLNIRNQEILFEDVDKLKLWDSNFYNGRIQVNSTSAIKSSNLYITGCKFYSDFKLYSTACIISGYEQFTMTSCSGFSLDRKYADVFLDITDCTYVNVHNTQTFNYPSFAIANKTTSFAMFTINADRLTKNLLTFNGAQLYVYNSTISDYAPDSGATLFHHDDTPNLKVVVMTGNSFPTAFGDKSAKDNLFSNVWSKTTRYYLMHNTGECFSTRYMANGNEYYWNQLSSSPMEIYDVKYESGFKETYPNIPPNSLITVMNQPYAYLKLANGYLWKISGFTKTTPPA